MRGPMAARLVTTKRMSRPSLVASMRATARRSATQPLALWRVSAKSRTTSALLERTPGAHGLGDVLDLAESGRVPVRPKI